MHVYTRPIAGPGMRALQDEYAKGRAIVDRANARNLRRGYFWTLVIAAAAIWAVCLAVLTIVTSRITRPLEQLTAGLGQLASGNLDARLHPQANDEIGQAMVAFNDTAERLRIGQERLVNVTRLASWQTLARKMAHEVKNSLTPIRLTMEEMLARRGERDERVSGAGGADCCRRGEHSKSACARSRSSPPSRRCSRPAIDVNALVEERIAFLKSAHPEVSLPNCASRPNESCARRIRT